MHCTHCKRWSLKLSEERKTPYQMFLEDDGPYSRWAQLSENDFEATIIFQNLFVFGLLWYHGTLARMTQTIDDQIGSANTGLLCKQLLNSHFALDFLWLLQYTALCRRYSGPIWFVIVDADVITNGCDLNVDQYSSHGKNVFSHVSLCQSNRQCGLAEAKAVWFVKVPARVWREDDDGDDVDC